MVSTITARFSSGSPFIYRFESFTMLCTLEFEYLNKLTKRQVRDFSSPEAFHAVNVQSFKAQGVKLSAKSSCKFPLPIKTLPCDFSVLSRNSTFCTIPTTRFVNLTTQTLIQGFQLIQGLLKKLWTLYLFAIAQCQERFQSKVKPSTFTRLGKGSELNGQHFDKKSISNSRHICHA